MFEMPDWVKQWQARGGYSPGAWGAPAPIAAPDPNAAMRAMVMSGQADPGAASGGFTNAPTVGPDVSGFNSPPMPPVRPQSFPTAAPAQSGFHAPASVPLPPPRPGGNWDTTVALEGDPAGQPDWAQQGAQEAAAADGRQVGPGSWFDPSKMGKMVDPNSIIGKMMSMRNPSAAPQAQGQPQGLLAPLFADGGMFGRDPTTPNNTTGGLW